MDIFHLHLVLVSPMYVHVYRCPPFEARKELPEFDINSQQEHICGIGFAAMDRHWGVRGKKMGMDFKMT